MNPEFQAPVAAIDLGATSGRVMIGALVDGKLELELVHRFANGPVPLASLEEGAQAEDLSWDIDELWVQIRQGLTLAFARRPDIAAIGVDSWAVDYALLADGQRLGQVRHYRDPRNVRAVPELEKHFERAELFERNGLQFLPFNTVYQLEAERAQSRLRDAQSVLLVPDYINWLLTGAARCEWTNASTTGLLNQRTGGWDERLASHLGVDGKLPELIHPGHVVGTLLPQLAAELGAGSEVKVVAVASHDTASAVAATPLAGPRSAYVSCGTWGLVQSAQSGEPEANLEELLSQAETLPVPAVLIDPQDERFLAPGRMPQRVSEAVVAAGGAAPSTRAELIRVIIESLASSFATQAFAAAAFGGFEPENIHVVGGGSQGRLLCQRTADLAGVPVVAGPVECTALGNVLVQLRTLSGSQVDLREMVRASVKLETYQPERTHSLA